MFQFNTKNNAVFFALLTFTSVQIAHAETNSIDAELNRVYQQSLTIARDPLRLKISQRNWLNFIKSDCDAESFNLGGSHSLLIASDFDECINSQKSERAKYLNSTYKPY